MSSRRLAFRTCWYDGPRGSEALAAEPATNRNALVRVLRALTGVKILVEKRPDKFTLPDLGRGLRSDVPQSHSAWAKSVARPPMWEAWGALLHTVRTGENAFEHVHGVNHLAVEGGTPGRKRHI